MLGQQATSGNVMLFSSYEQNNHKFIIPFVMKNEGSLTSMIQIIP